MKKDQDNSYVSVGKIVDVSTFAKEKERLFKLISAVQISVQIKDIVFNVDTPSK